jgi:hypothetical protein
MAKPVIDAPARSHHPARVEVRSQKERPRITIRGLLI